MVGMTKRNQQKQQLVSAGFSLDYVDGWPPSNECECQWCTERASEKLSSDTCGQCDFQAKGETPQAIASSLRMHMQHRHKEE